ncbi:helix-turn-helix transcriptional regulator [Dokdonella sp. MW10]|uniref:helix-turn-helix transcriptional regulator n=1 Tax=Dokdonella sp. MW10 TaxID=2992926 RepID=UPI003F7FC80E
MDMPEPAIPSLTERLATLADCARAGPFACITARREHGARAVAIDTPMLAVVLQGTKLLRGARTHLEIARGSLFVVTRACRLDVLNRPDPVSGLYLTVTVPLCAEVVDAARLLWAQPARQGDDDVVTLPATTFEAELDAWCDALRGARYAEARLALATILVRLCERGHDGVLAPAPPSLAAEVRALVAAQPLRAWRSRDLEEALGMSGATLRRRLAAERTTLLATIAEARLACAMELLYTTRLPLKTIAARVGYRSTATFVRRFVARYGLEPSAIGNT